MSTTVTERYLGLIQQLRDAPLPHNERPSDERIALTRLAAALMPEVLEEQRASWVSEPVVLDQGLVLMVVQVLLRLRREVEREMERNDLTPYMWSTMRSRYDALSKVFRMLERRALKDIDDWVIPEYLLFAEYDDGSLDFAEVADQSEADEVARAYEETGAVVTRYAVVPERGRPVIVHHPVLPFENVHRTMTQRQFNWVQRQKGKHNLTLPRNLHEFITHGVFDLPPGAGEEG